MSDTQIPPALTGRQRRQLRAQGHHLKPVVTIGKEGVTPALIDGVARELDAHALIKIKVLDTTPGSVREAIQGAADATGAAVVQVLGRTGLLFRPNDSKEPSSPDQAPVAHR